MNGVNRGNPPASILSLRDHPDEALAESGGEAISLPNTESHSSVGWNLACHSENALKVMEFTLSEANGKNLLFARRNTPSAPSL
jgi:hypothetical protein